MASPSFSINGNPVNTKASVGTGATVTATLDSTDGIRSIAWSIERTDDTSTPGDYPLIVSGSIGQTVTTSALGPGTAAVLKARINGGLDAQTDQPSDETIQEVKFFVPDSGALEVLAAGELAREDVVTSPTHGAVEAINAAIRRAAASTDWKESVRLATAAALPAHSFAAGVITLDAVGVLTVDGVAVVLGDRDLGKDEGGGTSLENGWYDCTTEGDGGTAAVLTRSADADADGEISNGSRSFVSADGASIGPDGAVFLVITSDDITVNTTPITFTEVGGAGGDVVGPASAVDESIPLYDGTSGKLIKAGSGLTSTAAGQLLSGAGTNLELAAPGGQNIAARVGGVLAHTITASGVFWEADIPMVIRESSGDPIQTLNAATVYSKDDGGVSELYARSSDGTVYQLTPTGVGSVSGSGTDHRLARFDVGGTSVQNSAWSEDDSGNLTYATNPGAVDWTLGFADRSGGGSQGTINIIGAQNNFGSPQAGMNVYIRGGQTINASDPLSVAFVRLENGAKTNSKFARLELEGSGGIDLVTGTSAYFIARAAGFGVEMFRTNSSEFRLSQPLHVDSFGAVDTTNYIRIATGATALSAANQVHLRSNAGVFEVSENGAAYAPVFGGGGGDVTGPGSSTDNAFARFDGATGKIIQNGPWVCDDTGNLTGPGGSNGDPDITITLNPATVDATGMADLILRGLASTVFNGDGGGLNLFGGNCTAGPTSAGGDVIIGGGSGGGFRGRTQIWSHASGSPMVSVEDIAGFNTGLFLGNASDRTNDYVTIEARVLRFNLACTSVTIAQDTTSLSGANHTDFHAQDTTSNSGTAGNMTQRAGDALGASGVTTGGDYSTRAGAHGGFGGSTHGSWFARSGDNVARITIGPTGDTTIASATNTTFTTPPVVPSYTVAGLPSASPAAQLAYVTDETGGAVLAFSDGTNWRRVTDRAIAA
jgi:hypothetical protein